MSKIYNDGFSFMTLGSALLFMFFDSFNSNVLYKQFRIETQKLYITNTFGILTSNKLLQILIGIFFFNWNCIIHIFVDFETPGHCIISIGKTNQLTSKVTESFFSVKPSFNLIELLIPYTPITVLMPLKKGGEHQLINTDSTKYMQARFFVYKSRYDFGLGYTGTVCRQHARLQLTWLFLY